MIIIISCQRKAVAVISLLEEQKKGSTALLEVTTRLTAVLDARAKKPPKLALEVLLDEFCKNQQQHGLITSMTTRNFMTPGDIVALNNAHEKRQQRLCKQLRELREK